MAYKEGTGAGHCPGCACTPGQTVPAHSCSVLAKQQAALASLHQWVGSDIETKVGKHSVT